MEQLISLAQLKGVGPVTLRALRKLGVTKAGDLLWHVPSGYEDFRTKTTIKDAPIKTPVTLTGTLSNIKQRRSWQKRGMQLTEATLTDTTGSLPVVWFSGFARDLPTEQPVYIVGQVTEQKGARQCVNPFVEIVSAQSRYGGRLVAQYPLTAGLPQWRLRALIHALFTHTLPRDYLPTEVRENQGLLALADALRQIHYPTSEQLLQAARYRLAFDELFLVQLSRLLSKQQRVQLVAPAMQANRESVAKVTQALPFTLTKDQTVVLQEIIGDLKKSHPMQRLVQGEVGSGKTAVAAVAALLAQKEGLQTIFLAPTSVLAEQHYRTVRTLFPKANVGLLTSKTAMLDGQKVQKRAVLDVLATYTPLVLIGTHALLTEHIKPKRLGLLIVDEQHRFGVQQRLQHQYRKRFRDQFVPHLLSMTATPIPRTLQMAFCGDLSVSTIKQMPKGERQVRTVLVRKGQRKQMEERLRKRLQKGEQAFVVCSVIDPTDKLQVKAATEEYERLAKKVYKEFSVGYLHGRMNEKNKQLALEAFRKKEIVLLVTTSVIEVGVDMDATTIVIEGAERFGLAQLHQLRGRVGRRGSEGFCLLLTENPSKRTLDRLSAFAKTTSGFALAELDLSLRGPGEWFGNTQSGFPEFRVATLDDTAMLAKVQQAGKALLKVDPTLSRHKLLREQVDQYLDPMVHAS